MSIGAFIRGWSATSGLNMSETGRSVTAPNSSHCFPDRVDPLDLLRRGAFCAGQRRNHSSLRIRFHCRIDLRLRHGQWPRARENRIRAHNGRSTRRGCQHRHRDAASSYGSDGNTGGFQLAYNLSTDQVVWTMSYAHGIDSHSITPDGTRIYMPEGEAATGTTWYVEDSSNGNDIATISSGGIGPHNTIVSPSGKHVYFGARDTQGTTLQNDFDVVDTSTNLIVGRVTPLLSGARPFTINSKETFAFITATNFIGFQVADLSTGKVIYTVAVDGSNIPGFTTISNVTGPSHGISLSPDDKEIYVVDQPNSYIHVFDVTGLPASKPVQVADISF